MWHINKHDGKQAIEMVFMDQTIGATLWQDLFPEFEAKLHCGSTYVIQNIKVVENHSEYKVSRIPFLVYLVKITSIKEAKCPEIPPNVNVITRFANIIAEDFYCLTVGTLDEVMIDTPWSYDSCPYCTTTFDPLKYGSTCCLCQNQVTDGSKGNNCLRYKLVLKLEQNREKTNFHFWDRACIKIFGKSVDRCRQELIASGDEIKVFLPCVDELLGKTWVAMFKYHVRMRQSSMLDVTEDEDLIQTMTSTIGLLDEPSIGKGKVVAAETSSQDYHPTPSLSQPTDYDPGLSAFVTPAKRMSISKPVMNSSLTNTHQYSFDNITPTDDDVDSRNDSNDHHTTYDYENTGATYNDIGDPVWKCKHYNAMMWYDERINKDKQSKNPRQSDGRLYNLPNTAEVAALIIGDKHTGEDDYRPNILHKDNPNSHVAKRKKVTMREYFCFRMQSRDNEAQTILHSKRLFQQWIVDGYTTIESQKLNYVTEHQQELRVDKYMNLNACNNEPETHGNEKGKRIILPSSFVGSRRYMEQLYFDGMAIFGHIGFPDLFLTLTCNPAWLEIQQKVRKYNLRPDDFPDVVS
ncbi:hypothetical protein GmHk_01G001829 [Glycine max]|nr:hypothetical protein GmHk_01G001829 [Glycine max]